MKTFSILNLGCKVNAYEAECVAEELEKRGMERVSFDTGSDAVLIFTCAVTNTAAAKSRKMLHRAKRRNPDCTVVMAGCYAQVEDGAIDEAELIIGSAHKKEIPDLLKQYEETGEKIRVLDGLENPRFELLTSTRFEEKTRAYLKVQDGCDQYCTYCVIPFLRGHERSMEPDTAVRTAVELSGRHSEIVLTGIHTGRYGKEHGVTLAQLMQRILEASELKRLRISSIEVTELTDEFLNTVENSERIARHLHIPLQSGSDGVLKRMHRPYTTEQYYEMVQNIRKRIPDISISADLIVGFPGETEEEFQETVEFLKKCGFSFLHVFPYSMRERTLAADMKDQVDPQVKKERAKVCAELSQELLHTYEEKWLGREAVMIAEQYKDGVTTGYTSEYIAVEIPEEIERGKEVKVILEEITESGMRGRLL